MANSTSVIYSNTEIFNFYMHIKQINQVLPANNEITVDHTTFIILCTTNSISVIRRVWQSNINANILMNTQ